MKKITEHTLEQFHYLQPPVYSPDGEWIAFLETRLDYPANCYRTNVCVLHHGEFVRLTESGDVASFAWTKDNTIVYPALRDEAEKAAIARGERLTSFYELCPKTGAEKKLFTVPLEKVGKFCILDNGQYAMVSDYRLGIETAGQYRALQEQEEIYHSFDELPFWKLNMGFQADRRNYLFVFDPASGALKQVNRDLENVTNFSASGNWLIYAATEHVNQVESWDVSINTYDAESGELFCVMPTGRLILRNHEVYGVIWDGKVLILGSEGKTYGRTESPAMWLTGLKGGELEFFAMPARNIGYRNILGDHKLCSGMVLPVGDRLYFTVTDRYNTYIQYCDTKGNWSEYLTPDGSVEGFDVRDGHICCCALHGNKMTEIYEDGKQLTDLNGFLSEYSVSTPEYLSFTNDNGDVVDGWVMKPIGYEPGKKYPGILSIHGGPRISFGTIFMHEHQMYANDGYFVFYCNPRGSEGYGDAFADIWGKMGTIDYDDLMRFTDVVLENYGDIDPKRLGVTGGSYGGLATNWIIGHTDRFAAACSARSISNWITNEYSTSQGYTWVPNFLHARVYEGGFEKLWNDSPLKYAPNAKTPTLFIVSDEDHECWMVEGIQMYTALKMAGTTAKLLMFRDESHELSRSGRPFGRIARLEELHSWMDKYLK